LVHYLSSLLSSIQDAFEELPRLLKQIREHVPLVIPNISEAFRIGYASEHPPSCISLNSSLRRVTEQPYKIPYYAALLRLLHTSGEDAVDRPPLGKQILEDFWKGFQAYLDKLAWRETRLCVS